MERTCGTCYWRNPSSGYCPKKGVDIEQDYPACSCHAEKTCYNDTKPKKTKNMPEFKKCNTCGRELPLDQFSKSNTSKDGYKHKCKECMKIALGDGQRKRHAGKNRAKPEKAEKPALAKEVTELLSGIPYRDIVHYLRESGWDVKCTRMVKEKL